MAEIAEQVQDTVVKEESNISTQLQDSLWGDSPVNMAEVMQKENQPVVEEKKEEVKTELKEEQPQVNEWWKELDFQDADTAKNEIKRLKEQKPQEEIKFANEESKKFFDYWKEGKLDEAHEIWAKNKQIEKLVSAEVSEATAPDILKAAIKNKYKEFSDADVERKFNKQYAIPKEPKYDELKETEEEFEVRKSEWQEKVAEIKADMLLDAKITKPELEKLKSELVLPDIKSGDSQVQRKMTQEELDAFNKQKESFVSTATKVVNDFSGFTAQVKDKDVDYSVGYIPSQEERTMVNEKIKQFAETGFDANAVFAERWLDKDGALNQNQMAEDLLMILTGKNSNQKIALEAANQRLELYLKDKKNIRIDNNGGKAFGEGEQKTKEQVVAEQIWGN